MLRHFLAIGLALFAIGASVGGRGGSNDAISLSSQMELVRLVDLAADRLGLRIEYDPKLLQGQAATLRIGSAVTEQELWALTNQLLASRGWAVVQTPGSEAGTLSIVKLSDAAAAARIEPSAETESDAGFISVIIKPQHRPAKDMLEIIKPFLSKPGGSIVEIGREGALIVSDLRPRVRQILDFIKPLDTAGSQTVVRAVEARHHPASELATQITAAMASRSSMSQEALVGKIVALSDDSGLVLMAPDNEVQRWLELASIFDQQQMIETRSYAIAASMITEVASLAEQIARDRGPRGSGEQWRMVVDPLTSSIAVTATASEHEQVAELMERLKQIPPETRRPIKAFPIRNRSVAEVIEVLSRLLDAGALEAQSGSVANSEAALPDRSRSTRELNALGSSIPIPGTSTPNGPRAATASSTPPTAETPALPSRPSEFAQSLSLTADEGTNTLIAVGDSWRLGQLESLLATLDVRQPQVMIEVLVVSLSEGDSLDLGVELQKIEMSGDTLIRLSSLFGLAGADPEAASGSGFTGLVLNPGDFSVLIRALQTLNQGRALNIPKALVNNNQQASLDAIIQQPFIATNASDTVATTSFGGFENAGTTLTIKPQIASGEHLVLEYSVSISAFIGESSEVGVPPPRQQNTLESVVTIPDGFTVAVGGIEVQNDAEAVSQIPILGDVPLLGEGFKSRSRSRSRSRFFVFIRPSVLRHMNFDDLRHLSGPALTEAQIDEGWPIVLPRVIQ